MIPVGENKMVKTLCLRLSRNYDLPIRFDEGYDLFDPKYIRGMAEDSLSRIS